ncbi:MAG: BrnT family toxin [Brevundimonas sp.]
MKISYDEAKRRQTLEARGLDFRDVGRVFAGDCLTVEDDRRDYGERRFQTMGLLDSVVVMVVWTPRDAGRRVISMRKCNAPERDFYLAELGRSR